MSDNAILMCCDKNLVNYLKGTISSMIKTGKWKGDIIVITDDEYPVLNELRERGCIVLVIDIDKYDTIFRHKTINNYHWNIGATFRWLAFFFDTFKRWDNIFYMDIDCIALNEIPEYKTKYLGASYEYCDEKHGYGSKCFGNTFPCDRFDHYKVIFESDFKDPEDPVTQKIFGHLYNEYKLNSGMLWINTNVICDSVKKCFLNCIRSYSKYMTYPDQGILNILFMNKWEDMGVDFGGHFWIYNNKINIFNQPIIHLYGEFIKCPWDDTGYFYKNHWVKNLKQWDSVYINVRKDVDNIIKHFNIDMIKYSDEYIGQTMGLKMEPVTKIKKFEIISDYKLFGEEIVV